MEELNSDNILEFWKNATIEQQSENIDKALDMIDSSHICDMWKFTKRELKIQNPDLITRIIREKFNNGEMYFSGLWSNTPPEVQKQKIEEVLSIYKRRNLMLKKILTETDESLEEIKNETLAKTLNYDHELLERYGILEYIPNLPNMFSKRDIDRVIFDLRNKPFIEVMKGDYIEDENVREKRKLVNDNLNDEEVLEIAGITMKYIMAKIPITSIPYFFKQLLEGVPEFYITLFWENIDNDIKNQVVAEVIEQIFSKRELASSIWNELS